jgi:hypothetical protein
VDFNTMLCTDKNKLLSIGIGLGINLGTSIKSSLEEQFNKGKYYRVMNKSDESINQNNIIAFNSAYTPSFIYEVYNTKSIKLKTTTFFKAYVPILIKVRFSKSNNVFKHISMFSQIRLGYDVFKLSQIKPKGMLGSAMQIGLIYKL